MENFLLEKKSIKQSFAPVDLNTAAVVGSRISLKDAKRCAIVLSVGASVAATLEITLKQHDASVGGNSKNLEIANKYYYKAGAAVEFTKVEPSDVAAVYDLSAQFAANAGIVVLEVLPEDLDVNADFDHISVEIADSAAAKIGAGLYVIESKEAPAHEVEL